MRGLFVAPTQRSIVIGILALAAMAPGVSAAAASPAHLTIAVSSAAPARYTTETITAAFNARATSATRRRVSSSR